MLNKATRQSLVEQAVEQMQHLIESGKWEVGNKIPAEPELMEQLNISRNTLREAVRALVHAGLMKTRQGDGTYVVANSILATALQRRLEQSQLLYIIELRHALEREAASLAAMRRTEADLEKINDCLQACRDASEAHNKEQYIAADLSLHKSIIAATHNPLIEEIYTHLCDQITDSIADLFTLSPEVPYLLTSHIDLVEAIIAGDNNRAAQEVQSFITTYKNIINAWSVEQSNE